MVRADRIAQVESELAEQRSRVAEETARLRVLKPSSKRSVPVSVLRALL